jgi:DNA-binding CsgD family transcriptional regulator
MGNPTPLMSPSAKDPAAPPTVAAARRDPAVWDRTEQAALVASWRWDLATGDFSWSLNFYRLLGLDPAAAGAKLTGSDFWDRVHPGDVERLLHAFEATAHGERFGWHDYRIIRPDGCVRHLRSIETAEEPANGSGSRVLVGLVRDVTDERASQRKAALNAAVSESLARWEAFRPGVEGLLARLAAPLDASAAALWVPDGDLLSLRVAWSGAEIPRTTFERQLARMRMRKGACLAGRAWAEGGPVAAAPGEKKVPGSWSLPIWPSVAFPALDSGRVLAVIALYGKEQIDDGSRLADELGEVGRQLGTFLRRRAGALRSGLTARETEVLTLAAQGLGGPAIAEALSLSGATVKTHLANAYAKIGVSSRVAAVAYALRAGLIE